MLDFTDEQLEAGRIRPSSNNIVAGTWMIPEKVHQHDIAGGS